MALTRKAARLGGECGHTFESLVAKLFDLSADRAEQMLVLWDIAGRFETAKAFAEIALDDQSAVNEDVDSPIDGRGADFCAARTEFGGDVLGGEMPEGGEQHIRDREPLRRDREIVLSKPRAEAIGYGVVCHSGSLSKACSSAFVMRSVSIASPARS